MTKKEPKLAKKSSKFFKLFIKRYVWKNHGLQKGLYRGLVSSLFLNVVYRGYSIGFYDTYKNVNQSHSVMQKIAVYSAVVCASSLVFHPLDTIRRIYMNENNYGKTKVFW